MMPHSKKIVLKALIEIRGNMNLVDERFELCSLIFRLMPYNQMTGHNEADTDYQRKLNSDFNKYASHPAVEYATSLMIGFDAVGHFALRLEKYNGIYQLTHDIEGLYADERWNKERTGKFLPMLNDFNNGVKFDEYFAAHNDFYLTESKKFHDTENGKIDFAWLEKYAHECKFHIIYSPSLSKSNYGCTVGANVYAIVPHGRALVHEFCHNFANPLAEKWYSENNKFRKLCDDSVNSQKLPWYANGTTMAREYVTRAFHVLYDVQHGAHLEARLAAERDTIAPNSFPHITEIYKMVYEYAN